MNKESLHYDLPFSTMNNYATNPYINL